MSKQTIKTAKLSVITHVNKVASNDHAGHLLKFIRQCRSLEQFYNELDSEYHNQFDFQSSGANIHEGMTYIYQKGDDVPIISIMHEPDTENVRECRVMHAMSSHTLGGTLYVMRGGGVKEPIEVLVDFHYSLREVLPAYNLTLQNTGS